MRKTIGAIAVVGALSAAIPAFAASPKAAEAPKPAEITNVIKADAPYGTGSLRMLFMSAYDAALWTDASRWSMQSPFAISMIYHFRCDASDIVDRAIDEMSHANPNLDTATLAHYRSLIAGVFPAVKSGDEMTALSTPDGTVKFFHDGQETGQVHDASFAQAFFGIWLSPDTSEPNLRAKLLHLDT
ncbi:MAG TPA: chalcone isomerase family protein [Rhizomicrobium sp.]|nr:chalcone isomerase family protein [Rhizomicrobium sp.]